MKFKCIYFHTDPQILVVYMGFWVIKCKIATFSKVIVIKKIYKLKRRILGKIEILDRIKHLNNCNTCKLIKKSTKNNLIFSEMNLL